MTISLQERPMGYLSKSVKKFAIALLASAFVMPMSAMAVLSVSVCNETDEPVMMIMKDGKVNKNTVK